MRRPKNPLLPAAAAVAMGVGAALSAPNVAASDHYQRGFSPTETGQVLIFPYYTVNGGWQSFMNVINTTESALAVKLRVHEYKNSRDVLDFNILLSPNDAWSAFLRPTPDGGAELVTMDNSCTSPQLPPIGDIPGAKGLPLNPLAYTGPFDDGGGDEVGRLTEGYVEMIVMGICPKGVQTGSEDTPNFCFSNGTGGDPVGMGWLTEHVDGTPRNCAAADARFVANTVYDQDFVPGTGIPAAGIPVLGGYHPVTLLSEVVGQPVKGNASYLNFLTGAGAGTEALHLDNVVFDTYGEFETDDGTVFYSSLLTAQEFPWFLEPTIATVGSPGAWDTSGLEGLEERFAWGGIVNEWSSNPTTQALTDWVINFPTKGFHVDQFCNQEQANNNRWRYDGAQFGAPALPCFSDNSRQYEVNVDGDVQGRFRTSSVDLPAPYREPFATIFNGSSAQPAFYTVFDREEGSQFASGTQPSPNPPAEQNTLLWETNVVAVGSGTSALSSPQVAFPPGVVDAPALLESEATAGWMKMLFSRDGESVALPAYGFIMKTRGFDGNQLFGQMMDHGYLPGYEVFKSMTNDE